MERQDDIVFLEKFRKLVDQYLFLGYAPGGLTLGNEEMEQALENPEFQNLRRTINEMKPRVFQLFNECHVAAVLVQYPAPAVGGPVIQIHMLDLLSSNTLAGSIAKHQFLDVIDQAIGVLKTNPPKQVKPKTQIKTTEIKQNFVFIAMPMSPDDYMLPDVHEAIKDVSREIGLVAERIDDPVSNDKITDRILQALELAEFVVADLTHAKQNVYFEAGYAQGQGKIPIYIAREGTRIEFDLKDYPVIFFKNITELKEKLKKRLSGLQEQKNRAIE